MYIRFDIGSASQPELEKRAGQEVVAKSDLGSVGCALLDSGSFSSGGGIIGLPRESFFFNA